MTVGGDGDAAVGRISADSQSEAQRVAVAVVSAQAAAEDGVLGEHRGGGIGRRRCIGRPIDVAGRQRLTVEQVVELIGKAGDDHGGGHAGKLIAGDRRDGICGVDEEAAVGAMVDDGIVLDNHIAEYGAAAIVVIDEAVVVGVGRFDHLIAFDQQVTAGGDVDGATGVAGTVVDDIVSHDGVGRDAFDVVAGVGIAEDGVFDDERICADVNSVRQAAGMTVSDKGRAGDMGGAVEGCGKGAKDAVFIVLEIAVPDGEVTALVADTGAVPVHVRGIEEADAVEGCRCHRLGDGEDAFGDRHVGIKVGASALTFEGQALAYRDAGGRGDMIGTGLDSDGIAVLRAGNSADQRLNGRNLPNSHVGFLNS